MMGPVPDYGSHDDVVVDDEQRQLKSLRSAMLAIALVASAVVSATMIGYHSSAAAPAAVADVAALSVQEAEAAAMRDFGEVTAETIETEATMAKYGVRLAETTTANGCSKGVAYCQRQIAQDNDPCRWGSGSKCGGCPGVCGNAAVTEPPVVVEDWEMWGANGACAVLPLPNWTKHPDDVVNLDVDWKLQLPCLDIATDGNGTSYCTDDREELINGKASPGVWTVYMSESASPGDYDGPYLGNFKLMPTEYGAGNEYCSGGMYVADDEDGEEMVVLYVPIAGTTTPGSKNPRVELRQMLGGSSSNAGFSLVNDDGENKLKTTQRVMHVPANYKSTSVVQVFNGGYSSNPPVGFLDGGPFIEIITQKCQYSWQQIGDTGTRCPSGAIGIGIWKDGKFGGQGGFIFEEYTLGTKFDLEVVIPGDGSVTMKYRHTGDAEWRSTYTFDCDELPDGINPCLAGQSGDASYPSANGVYFKVGSYLQKAPDEEATDYALTYMYSAEVSGPATR